MLGHCKLSLEKGYIVINPAFDKLITSLRTAVAEENTLDKESMSYADVFDAYRLALKDYKFITREIDNESKTVTAKRKLNWNA
jgi:DNA modification methylase